MAETAASAVPFPVCKSYKSVTFYHKILQDATFGRNFRNWGVETGGKRGDFPGLPETGELRKRATLPFEERGCSAAALYPIQWKKESADLEESP